MGLLAVGTPLCWVDARPHIEHVKTHGIAQFIATYRRLADRTDDAFLWGDEIEYLLLRLDPETKHVYAVCNAHVILDRLEGMASKRKAVFHPEYGKFMIETTPGRPYRGFTTEIPLVESNMALRRRLIDSILDDPNDQVVSMASFPALGFGRHTFPDIPAGGTITQSSYVPDTIMNPHPRFPYLTRNIRERRTDKVSITIPLFQDANVLKTNEPPKTNEWGDLLEDTPDTIHMDAMAFGMGCCCLQATFQCRNIAEARHLYDQLAVLGPIMLALTAASPFFKGLIADTDVRWNVVSQAVDDRTPFERGLTDDDDGRNQLRLSKSRYSSIDCFIGTSPFMSDEFNDVPLPFHDRHLRQLQEANIDDRLARHVAHLFVRDPLVIFSEHIDMDDETETDHFESIQSTNWNSVRFKPPPSHSTTGWRVEFRTMEVQITDFENAAFTIFIALLSRAVLSLNLNFYIPVSMIDMNMDRAHTRDAVNLETFFMRLKTKKDCAGCECESDESAPTYKEMTIKEIICGEESTSGFPGLLSFITTYLDAIDCDKESRALIDEYIDFIEMRARGDLLTMASWMRRFVLSHPGYKQDSKLTHAIIYDLIEVIHGLGSGQINCPQLLPVTTSPERKLKTYRSSPSEQGVDGVPLTIDLTSSRLNISSICEKIQSEGDRRRKGYHKKSEVSPPPVNK